MSTSDAEHPLVEEIGLRELRQHASDVVRRAEAGTEFVVTVAGRAAARLTGTGLKTWGRTVDLAAIYNTPPWGDMDDTREYLDQHIRDPWDER